MYWREELTKSSSSLSSIIPIVIIFSLLHYSTFMGEIWNVFHGFMNWVESVALL